MISRLSAVPPMFAMPSATRRQSVLGQPSATAPTFGAITRRGFLQLAAAAIAGLGLTPSNAAIAQEPVQLFTGPWKTDSTQSTAKIGSQQVRHLKLDGTLEKITNEPTMEYSWEMSTPGPFYNFNVNVVLSELLNQPDEKSGEMSEAEKAKYLEEELEKAKAKYDLYFPAITQATEKLLNAKFLPALDQHQQLPTAQLAQALKDIHNNVPGHTTLSNPMMVLHQTANKLLQELKSLDISIPGNSNQVLNLPHVQIYAEARLSPSANAPAPLRSNPTGPVIKRIP